MKSVFEKYTYNKYVSERGNVRLSYYSLKDVKVDDLMIEYLECLKLYLDKYWIIINLLDLFYVILSHVLNEILKHDLTKAEKFFNKVKSVLQRIHCIIVPFNDISELTYENSPYFRDLVMINGEEHSIFVAVIQETKSVYLPLYLKKVLCLSVKSEKGEERQQATQRWKSNLARLDRQLERETASLSSATMPSLNIRREGSASSSSGTDYWCTLFKISVPSDSALYDDVTCGSIQPTDWSSLVLGCDYGRLVYASTSSSSITSASHNWVGHFGGGSRILATEFVSGTADDIGRLNNKNNNLLLTSGSDATVKLWEADSAKLRMEYSGLHGQPGWGLASATTGAQFAVACGDGSVSVYDLNRDCPVRKMVGHLNPVKSVNYHDNNNYIVSCGESDGTVRMWDVRSGSCIRMWSNHIDCSVNFAVFCGALNRKSQQFIVWCNDDSSIELVDLDVPHSHVSNATGGAGGGGGSSCTTSVMICKLADVMTMTTNCSSSSWSAAGSITGGGGGGGGTSSGVCHNSHVVEFIGCNHHTSGCCLAGLSCGCLYHIDFFATGSHQQQCQQINCCIRSRNDQMLPMTRLIGLTSKREVSGSFGSFGTAVLLLTRNLDESTVSDA